MKPLFQSAFSLLGIAGLATIASAQDVSKFHVYGFADMNLEYRDNNSSFMSQYVGADTLAVVLGHANLYFDFNPNEHIRALMEIGFTSNKIRDFYSPGAEQNLIIDNSGNAVTDAQIIAAVTQTKLDSIAGAANMSVSQLEAAMPGTSAQVQSAVTTTMTPLLTQVRAQAKDPTKQKDYQNITIQRAYFDLLFKDQINVRVGQFITPAGIWNVDHASPAIVTVRQPFQTSATPIFPESQFGIMGFGRQYLGDHELSYNLYATSGRTGPSTTLMGENYNNSIDNVGDLAYGGHVGVKLDMLKGISFGASAMTGTMREKYASSQYLLDLTSLLSGEIKSNEWRFNNYLAIQDRENIIGGDLKVEVSNLTVQGECNYRAIDNELTKGNTDMLGYYGLVNYRIPLSTNFSVSPYAMYENVSWNGKDAGASSLNEGPINGFYTVLLGANISLYTNLHIKLEWGRVTLLTNDDYTGFSENFDKDALASNVISTQFSVAF